MQNCPRSFGNTWKQSEPRLAKKQTFSSASCFQTSRINLCFRIWRRSVNQHFFNYSTYVHFLTNPNITHFETEVLFGSSCLIPGFYYDSQVISSTIPKELQRNKLTIPCIWIYQKDSHFLIFISVFLRKEKLILNPFHFL